jgi:hypothetical protein
LKRGQQLGKDGKISIKQVLDDGSVDVYYSDGTYDNMAGPDARRLRDLYL